MNAEAAQASGVGRGAASFAGSAGKFPVRGSWYVMVTIMVQFRAIGVSQVQGLGAVWSSRDIGF